MFHLETNLHSWCLFHCRVGKNQSVVIRVINPPLKLTKTPLKIGPAPKGKFIFQPSIFRCYWWFRNPANHLGCTKPCKEWDKQLVLDSQVPAVSFKEGSSKLDLRPILKRFCAIPSHLWLQVWGFFQQSGHHENLASPKKWLTPDCSTKFGHIAFMILGFATVRCLEKSLKEISYQWWWVSWWCSSHGIPIRIPNHQQNKSKD